MGKLRFRSGAAMVELDDELDRDLRAFLDDLAPGLVPTLEAGVTRIAEEAIEFWPEKSGDSKKAFEYGVRLPNEDRVEGFIVNAAEHSGKPYAYLIKDTNGRQIWREWLEKPAQAFAEQLLDELPAELVERLRRT